MIVWLVLGPPGTSPVTISVLPSVLVSASVTVIALGVRVEPLATFRSPYVVRAYNVQDRHQRSFEAPGIAVLTGETAVHDRASPHSASITTSPTSLKFSLLKYAILDPKWLSPGSYRPSVGGTPLARAFRHRLLLGRLPGVGHGISPGIGCCAARDTERAAPT